MSKKTFQIISGVTTAVATALVSILNIPALGVPNAALWSGIVVAVAGCIDEVCALFIKELPDTTSKKK
jgi:hypothetical protein